MELPQLSIKVTDKRTVHLQSGQYSDRALCDFFTSSYWTTSAHLHLEVLNLARVEGLYVNAKTKRELFSVLKRAVRLTRLDLSNTGLSQLELAELLRFGNLPSSLVHLDLSGNPIKAVRGGLSWLRKLRTLDLRNCSLEYVSGVLMIHEKLELLLYPNELLVIPPAVVQAQGPKAIRAYLMTSENWYRRKMVNLAVLGHSEAGKTTLIKMLRKLAQDAQPKSQRPEGSRPTDGVIDLPSTVGIDESNWQVSGFQFDARDVATEFNVTDFAGQIEYLSTHKPFLPISNTIFLLVTDATQPVETQKARLRHWIDMVEARMEGVQAGLEPTFTVKKPYVLVVGTKSDLVTINRDQLQKVMMEVMSYVKMRLGPDIRPHLISNLNGIGHGALWQDIIHLGLSFPGALPRNKPDPSEFWIPALFEPIDRHCKKLKSDNTLLVSARSLRAHSPVLMGDFLWAMCLGELRNQVDARAVEGIRTSLLFQGSIVTAMFVAPVSHKLRTIKRFQQPLYEGAIISRDDAIARLSQMEVLRLRSEAMLGFLEELELCFSLGGEAEKIFQVEGYLFPLLRPVGVLILPPPSSLFQSDATVSFLCLARQLICQGEFFASELFFRLQVALRERLFFRYKVHSNAMIIWDGISSGSGTPGREFGDANRALLTLTATLVNVVVQGPDPLKFWNFIFSCLKRVCLRLHQRAPEVRPLCPLCAQGIGIISTIDEANRTCSRGHAMQEEIDQRVAPLTPTLCLRNEIWSPREWDSFYATAEWRTKLPLSMAESATSTPASGSPQSASSQGFVLVPPLALSSGAPASTQPSHPPLLADRSSEDSSDSWLSHRSGALASQRPPLPVSSGASPLPLRYCELRPDGSRAASLEYVRAKDLFYKFVFKDKKSCYELEKIVFVDNPVLEREFARKFLHLQERHMVASARSSTEAWNATDREDDKQWRSWVMSRFLNDVDRFSDNQMNLVAGWHGTTEENCFEIARSNFRDPSSEDGSRTDSGYFGRGIYFTQYPSYSAKYATSRCLLLSWLLMGRVYPAIESPLAEQSLLGKPCRPGFDSHYAVVKQMNEKSYFPCKPTETIDYDEIVVFSQAQVLPRYIIYYTRHEKAISSPPVDLKASVLLWVDDKTRGEHTKLISAWESQSPHITFKSFTSSDELRIWVQNREKYLAAPGAEVRIITNRYRERDGGSGAADQLIYWIRNRSFLPRAKVLIFCSNPTGVSHLLEPGLTFVTSLVGVCFDFASFKAIP